MKNSRKGIYIKQRFSKGFSLIELMVTIAISIIPISLISVLLISGQYSWDKTYEQTNKKIEIEGQLAASVFGRVGRKATRNNCSFTSIIKDGSNDIIRAKEVTFQYWCKIENQSGAGGGTNGLDTDTMVTETARFYFSNNQLKVDYQRGGNPDTVVLANNVHQVEFSRNANQGCVRMVLELQDVTGADPYNETVTITAAAFMRG